MISLENKTYDEISIGDRALVRKRLTLRDIELFAIMSGDHNPAHLDQDYAKGTPFHEVIAHGMWGGALVSSLLGMQLPGPGTIYLGQTLVFHAPVHIGDEIEFLVEVTEKVDHGHKLSLDCRCTNQAGTLVISGTARVKAPTEKIITHSALLPEYRLLERRHMAEILKRTENLAPVRAAVVHPVTAHSLRCVERAVAAELIHPILVGPEGKIRAAAEEAGIDIGNWPIQDTEHSHAAARRATSMARDGLADILIKGSLHTHELLEAVIDPVVGLRTNRRISHVFVFDVPTYERLLLITDAAINIEPSLETKADIVQNAIDFAHAIGIAQPKVALLSAVEQVTPKIRSTVEAAALCKMADRGQITGGILDGPLAFDNAISAAAAHIKGIESPVSGLADILLAPNLEAGNMIAKQLEYLADARGAGLVLGARVPIVLTSRADQEESMALSCALATLMFHQQTGSAL